jgi:oligoendopeptidase F
MIHILHIIHNNKIYIFQYTQGKLKANSYIYHTKPQNPKTPKPLLMDFEK